MSYARFSKTSSVYVFQNTDLVLECCGCSLTGGTRHTEPTVAAMVEHLHAHEAAGGRVPASTYEYLLDDERDGVLQ